MLADESARVFNWKPRAGPGLAGLMSLVESEREKGKSLARLGD